MRPVNIHQAKTHLSRLLARVARGQTVVIAKNGVPVAELRPYGELGIQRHLGEFRGRIKVADDFNAPLPAEVLASFAR